MARPSKYSEAYSNEVVEFLARGHSLTAFAGEVGVAPHTLWNWCDEHPEFLQAVKKGRAKAVAFWERKLVNLAETGKGNATAVIFGLKNRAPEDWSERQQIEHSGPDGGPIETNAEDPRKLAQAVVALLRQAEVTDKET